MKKINEEFICIACNRLVPKADKTSRNHCPYCFTSQHVDETIPWDRAAACKGVMYPISYIIANGWIKIQFKCIVCWKVHNNKSLDDDTISQLDFWINTYKWIFERL